MKKTFILFLTVILTSICWGHEEKYPERPSWDIVSRVYDSLIPTGMSEVVFTISDFSNSSYPVRIVYSVDDDIDTVFLDLPATIDRRILAGKHSFQFYLNDQYEEIDIPKIDFPSQYRITVSLFFKSNIKRNMEVKKPVIYLYPEVATSIKVEVEPQGELTFTYPEYKDAWNVIANPNGDISIDNETYRYLFWESEQAYASLQFTTSKGFTVNRSDVTTFLQDKLKHVGFNSIEIADFITFWGPELMKNEVNFVQFVINEDCDRFAELTISPQPDTKIRFYMLYSNLDEVVIPSDFEEQILPSIERKGFTVLEWGGSEISIPVE